MTLYHSPFPHRLSGLGDHFAQPEDQMTERDLIQARIERAYRRRKQQRLRLLRFMIFGARSG